MGWDNFLFFAIPAMICWLAAGILVFKLKKSLLPDCLMILGIVIFLAFIIGLWINQQRPPLRTVGETRLWYSFFLSLVGYLTYKKWKYAWLLFFSSFVASIFVLVNIFKPGVHSTSLMPALQSYWFVPHVTVYILSYAMLGAATIAAIIQLIKLHRGKSDDALFQLMDNVVYIGFGFLILGMLMGALWAEQAWGRYWSWDPKETWAFITSAAYLVYIHLRLQSNYVKFSLWMLPVAFILLMVTWIGINYLPAAQHSIHVYSRSMS